MALSTTWRVIGPAVSCSAEIGTTPVRLTRPRVGLWPTMSLIPAGHTIDPSVSVPIATWARVAAIAAPEPDDEPHGFRSSTYGLFVWPPTPDQPDVEWVDRKLAHSDRFVLPRITAPPRCRRLTSGASAAGRDNRAREPAVAGWTRVSTLSLSSTGIPSSGLSVRPARCRASLAAASASARGLREMTEWILPSMASIRRR